MLCEVGLNKKCLILITYFLFRIRTASCVECNSVPTIPGGPIVQQVTTPLSHGEGPIWNTEKQTLFFVDIEGYAVHSYQPSTKRHTSAYVGKDVSFIFPIKGTEDEFLIGRSTDLVRLKWNRLDTTLTPDMEILTTVDQTKPPGNRFNDAKIDATGRLWAGTMGYEDPVSGVKPGLATLYRMSKSPLSPGPCKLEPMVSNVSISNGLVWNAEQTRFYYIDTPTRKIDVFDYDIQTGSIANRRTLFDFQTNSVPGSPDGMTIDSDGKLWIACWGGGRIIRVDPVSSALLTTIPIPADRVSSLVFGGFNFDNLYVTTMRKGLTPQQLVTQPLAGALFKITNLPTRGIYFPAVNNCDQWTFK